MRTIAPLRHRRDAGFTLAEVLVAMVISTIVIAVGVSLLAQTFRVSADTQNRAELWGQMSNTSVSLIRDVNDSTRVVVAEPQHLAIQVLRDGKCLQREWEVDGDQLLSTTTFYDAVTCTGGSTERVVEAVRGGLTGMAFTYYSHASLDAALSTPVDASQVSRIGWVITGTPRDSTAVLRLESSAAVMRRGTATDGGGAEQVAVAADLAIVTHETGIPGVHQPVLRWTDRSPEVTQGWSVYRTAYPDGANAASSSGWAQVAYLRTDTPAPASMTWTDSTLPSGYTGLYTVRATTPDGYGPSSNQIASGLRAVAPGLTTTGSQTSITLSWTAPVGATGYDLYRSDGGATESAPVLYKRWSDIQTTATRSGTGSAARWTWTDSLPPGQARTYSVVAVNRWERLATTTTQTGELPTGEPLAKLYSGTTQTTRTATRAASTTSGAFTAPAQPDGPSLALSSATSATDYSSRVTWTPAAWTGGGPVTATDGQGHRDRGWASQRRTTGGYTAVWPTETPRGSTTKVDSGTAPDLTYGYQVRTVNGAGSSAWSAERRLLQRPAVPSRPSLALSGLTTRQATVTAATSSSATSWTVEMTTGAGSSAMRGARATAPDRRLHYNELTHSSDHSFRTRSTNVAPSGTAGGGTSAWGATGSVRTDVLGVAIGTPWSDTKTVDLTLTATRGAGGSAARIELTRGGGLLPGEGVGTKNGAGRHSWTPLRHHTEYVAYAVNGDGYNEVSTGPYRVATQRLPAPVISDGWSDTKTISLTLSAPIGDPRIELTRGGVIRPGEGVGTKTGSARHHFTPLVHNTTYQAWGAVTDGFNTVTAGPVPVATQRLPDPVISGGWSDTKSISLTVSAAVGEPRIELTRGGASGSEGIGMRNGPGRYTWDPLVHNRTYYAYAANADGYNTTSVGPVAVATQELTLAPPPTPSCNVSSGSPYAPTTVYFSSNGTISRSSASAGSAGYYGATSSASHSRSDGYNTVSRSSSNSCGINIAPPPAPATPSGISIVSYTPSLGAFIFPYDPSLTMYTYQMRYLDVETGLYATYPAVTSPASAGQVVGGRIYFQMSLPYVSGGQSVSWSSFGGRGMVQNPYGASGWSGWTR